jgi:hypothetical protein
MSVLSTKERLSRVEANMEQLIFETRQLHGDLRASIETHCRSMEQHETRVRALEQNAEQTKTHLRWMKAAWAAAQAAILAWVGLK